MKWTKPLITEINTKDLVCKISVRAESACSAGTYAEDNACSVQATADTWCNSNPQGLGGGNSGGDSSCSLNTACDLIIF